MQRPNSSLRRSNSVLLYGIGLTLALSLGFNGYLLYEQSLQRGHSDYELGYTVRPVDLVVWQQQLSDCKRANEQKDSLIRRLEKTTNAPPAQAVIVQHMSTR